jgi:tetratricopeptide (TPR) repeat protein
MPQPRTFYFALGEACYLADRDDEAIQQFSKALEKGLGDPWLAVCLFDRGHSSLLTENPDQAIGDFTGALAADPERYDAYYLRGLAYFHTGDYDRCRDDLEEFLTVCTNPQYAADARAVLSELE